MLIKTHLAITLCFVLVFFNYVEDKLVFVFVALVATFIPDIDSRFSSIGQKKVARILQFFTKHRGVIHSYTFLFVVTFFIVLFFPVIAFGFFLGYGLHLFADSFTKEGIVPFYPNRKRCSWKISTGGKTEILIFVLFVIIDVSLVLSKISL